MHQAKGTGQSQVLSFALSWLEYDLQVFF